MSNLKSSTGLAIKICVLLTKANSSRKLAILLGLLWSCWHNPTVVSSQIVPDNTLGEESTQVTPNQNINDLPSELIEGGALRGSNLFHSFSEFNVESGQGAYFANPDGIANIFSRVTGNNASEIMGTLGVLGSADLFLINPNGIISGENASLDLNGSFAATTATAVQFGEQGFFNADEPNAPPLLTVQPSALVFNQVNSETIENRSVAAAGDSLDEPLRGLRVADGENLLLAAGEIILDGGGLNAVDGRIEVMAVMAGEIGIVEADDGLSFDPASKLETGDISLRNTAVIDTSGIGAGAIRLRGRDISLSDLSEIDADVLGNGEGGDIAIVSENLAVDSESEIDTGVAGSGNGGDVKISTNRLSIFDGAVIGVITEEGATGNAGGVDIEAREIEIDGGSNPFNPLGAGIISDSRTEQTTGDVTINTESLRIANLSRIGSVAQEAGDASNVIINAEQIEIEFDSDFLPESESNFPSIFAIVARSEATGNGGNIVINTDSLKLDRGTINSSSRGLGDAGNVNITAETIEVIGSGDETIFAGIGAVQQGEGIGTGGDITIETSSLSIIKAGQISVFNDLGEAGNIQISADSLFLDRSLLNGTTGGINTASGANITLDIAENLILSNDSTITAEAFADANGGNIDIDTGFLIAFPSPDSDGSDILANAVGGRGGRITINSKGVFGISSRENLTEFNDITASSEFGLFGEVVFNVPEVNPVESSINLPQTPTEATIAQICQPSEAENRSEFSITNRGGISDSPFNTIYTDSGWEDWGDRQQQEVSLPSSSIWQELEPESDRDSTIVEAQKWIVNDKGNVVLVAGTPVSSSISDRTCQSDQE